jgi:DNA helicase HerA-like ATPase
VNQVAIDRAFAAAPADEQFPAPAEERVRIGHVVSVSGSHAVAVLERSDDASGRDKDPRIQVGGVVRIQIPGSAVVGLISAISAPMPEMAGKKYDIGLIEINLTGEICVVDEPDKLLFRRGVTCLPSLGDAVLIADRHDLNCIFAPTGTHSIKIGSLYQDSAVPARLLTDDLLRKHFIVVGSTGSGKSCALTCILQRLLEVRKTAHIVILDVHDEYSTAFGDLVERITLDDFNLPLWMLNFNELCVALTSNDSYRDDEIEILNQGVLFAKKRYADAVASRNSVLARRLSENLIITADTPAPFRVSDVIAFIQDELGKLERTRMIAPYRRLKTKLEMLAVDQRYNFMFGSLTVEDTMTDVLSRLFRIPNNGHPISVIDLSTVPHEMLDVVVSVISRLAFDLAVWSEGGLQMLIVCEEAHRYVPVNGDDKFVPTRTALGRIAKEGRKYGISLGLVTQRPSELDTTILSQCSTAIALRLASEKDQQVIRGSTYEGMVDLIDFLPLLADREAIILGQGAAMPMRIRIDEVATTGRPHTMSPGYSHNPDAEEMDRTALDAIVKRWRTTGREKSSD